MLDRVAALRPGHRGWSRPHQSYTGKLALLLAESGGEERHMSATKPNKLSLEKVLHLLRKPDARLVRLHSNNGGAGFYVWPNGGHVSNEVVQLLLGRNDIQPYGSGVFPGHPQSWRLGNWRDWAGAVQ